MNIEETNVINIYSKIANEFNNTRHYKWPWIEKFIESKTKNSLFLDIGCGNGRNMMNKDYNFKGIDNCSKFIDICKSKNLEVYLSDMCKTGFNDNSIDNILCIASFHHLSIEERRINALLEMYKILKPGGEILLSVWSKNQPLKTKRKFDNYGDNYVNWVDKSKEIYKRYYYIFKLEELIMLIKKTNFVIINKFWDCGNEIFIIKKNK